MSRPIIIFHWRAACQAASHAVPRQSPINFLERFVLSPFQQWYRDFLPAPIRISLAEQLRSSLGAMIGILSTAVITYFFLGSIENLPLVAAPLGASAVLLFGVPASPLAQPWALIGGNLIGAVVGVSCANLIAMPLLAAAVAVAVTVMLMFSLRCVHPPSGAVAITAVLGGSTIHSIGYAFALFPVGINSLALLASALVYHRLTGHRYPHRANIKTPAMNEEATEMFTRADLYAVLRRSTEIVDVDVADLEWMLEEVARESHRRRMKNSHPS